MNEINWPAPCGYTIFCDDIRQEIGGKPSYMGAYMGRMLVGAALPIALPKFVCAVHYFEKPDTASTPLELRIFFPGDSDDAPSYRMPIAVPPPMLDQLQLPALEDGVDDLRLAFQFPVTFAPFLIAQAGTLKVRMFRGDNEVVRIGALRIESQPGLGAQLAAPQHSKESTTPDGDGPQNRYLKDAQF